jgi:hypothetical protein
MLVAFPIHKDNKIMFTVIGCLGSIVAQVNSTDEAVHVVLRQLPISVKKTTTLRNALERLPTGSEYQVEYGTSGCTVRRV